MRRAFASALLAVCTWPLLAQAAELSVPHELYTLDNGLTVILAPDRDLPVVQVNLWYYVGSRDETAGRTGFAHLFEHLMFQGSQHNNRDYFGPLQEVGARINGTTSLDRTNYFEGVPSQYLPLALWAEADRMGYLLPTLTPDKLQNQKDVVRNERRQRYENRPYGTSWITLLANTFPEGHPYHHPTIGNHEDIENATLEDVSAFFRAWYVPNNASLVVCGDFDTPQTKALIERYFGGLPAGAEPTPVAPAPVVPAAEKVIRQEEAGVPHQKVWLAWPSPGTFQPGDAELDLLASVLSDGKSSRLVRELVVEKRLAKDISATQLSFQHQSLFLIEATAAEGQSTDTLVAAIDGLLATVRTEGPTASELDVARVNYEVNFWNSLSTVSGKADRMQSYYALQGDPDWFAEDLARYTQATPDSVRQAAAQTLGEGRVVLHIVPPAAPAAQETP